MGKTRVSGCPTSGSQEGDQGITGRNAKRMKAGPYWAGDSALRISIMVGRGRYKRESSQVGVQRSMSALDERRCCFCETH